GGGGGGGGSGGGKGDWIDAELLVEKLLHVVEAADAAAVAAADGLFGDATLESCRGLVTVARDISRPTTSATGAAKIGRDDRGGGGADGIGRVSSGSGDKDAGGGSGGDTADGEDDGKDTAASAGDGGGDSESFLQIKELDSIVNDTNGPPRQPSTTPATAGAAASGAAPSGGANAIAATEWDRRRALCAAQRLRPLLDAFVLADPYRTGSLDAAALRDAVAAAGSTAWPELARHTAAAASSVAQPNHHPTTVSQAALAAVPVWAEAPLRTLILRFSDPADGTVCYLDLWIACHYEAIETGAVPPLAELPGCIAARRRGADDPHWRALLAYVDTARFPTWRRCGGSGG
ncbi:unnamed protein product, partial [Phaeothamnion confervicola]